MGQPLNIKFMYGDELLIAYLDLCGTKFVYSKFELSQQIERISLVIREVLDNFENAFTKDKEFLYVHMYADSIVITERPNSNIDKCADRLIKLMLFNINCFLKVKNFKFKKQQIALSNDYHGCPY